MKKFLLLSILSCSLYSTSQTYIPLPDSAGVWVNEGREYYLDENFLPVYHNYKYVNYCTSGEDTIIGTKTYTQVDTCGGNYKGAIRDSSGYVYYVPGSSSTEYLLYCFSAQINDTLFNVYSEDYWGNVHPLQDHVINQIDSTFVGGEWRTNMYSEQGAMWREGIGNVRGLFWDNFDNISMYFVDLICQSTSGTKYFPGYGNGSCTQIYTEVSKEEINFQIYPNPSIQSLMIEFSPIDVERIIIYDLLGRKMIVLNEQFSSKANIDISFLESGTYVLELASGAQKSRQTFIKL